MITLLVVAAAVAVLLWPSKKGDSPLFRLPQAVSAAPAPPSDPREAIDSLLQVRERLKATSSLDEESEKALDTIWLDLLHGSERK